MLAKKNRLRACVAASVAPEGRGPSLPARCLVVLLAAWLAGCSPSGPGSLLKGKKLLEEGDYPAAVSALQTAARLLPDNAAAWNYLGVAYQKADQPDNAATAYQRSLALNRDLLEAHWNLGMLDLEQNRVDQALNEFTVYTLRRPNETGGWLKLAAAQLRLGQSAQAEASFKWVLRLDRGNAEALNGLGLACLEKNRPRDAIQYFAYSMQQHPGDATATLNLAVTEQTYLHDNRAALQYYQAYLALTPKPANYDEVSAEASSLAESLEEASAAPPANLESTQTPPPVVAERIPLRQATAPPPTPAPTHPEPPRPTTRQTAPTPTPSHPAPIVAQNQAQHPAQHPPQPTVVRRPPAPSPIVTHPPANNHPAAETKATPPVVHRTPPPTPAPTVAVQTRTPEQPPAAVETPAPQPQPANDEPPPAPAPAQQPQGFWGKLKPGNWFGGSAAEKKAEETEVTPLPTHEERVAAANAAEEPVSLASFPRYHYQAPAPPIAGDRRAASGAYTRAQVYEQAANFVDAAVAYHSAAEFDPSWSDAQYHYAVLSYRLGNYRQALSGYEMALAIQRDSMDARRNFALTLKAAGFVPDAINEYKRLLAAHPGDAPAHLELARLYDRKLHDRAQAREHYQKVLQLDPDNAEAGVIRGWLATH